MKLIVVVLSAFVTLTTARNATFYTVDEAVEDQYIIVMKPGYDTEAIRDTILKDNSGMFSGSSIKYTYTHALNGISAKLPKKALDKLLARDDVKYITQDGVVEVSSVGSWGLDRVSERDLPLDGTADFSGDGTGVNVYVIDTGIYYDSLHFGGRAKAVFDFQSREGADYGVDCQGHGTHVSGTIGANTYGVAPGVKLLGVRVLDCSGRGSWSTGIAGIDYVTKNGVKPAVVSFALGGDGNTAGDEAIQGMINAGFTTIVPGLNYNDDACNYSPPRGKDVIAVGALETDDSRASFSNYGSCIDVFAPGRYITSVGLGREIVESWRGCSMACAHVTGAAAILVAAYPDCPPPADIKSRIIELASTGRVINPGPNSPNRLLFVP